jgi:hypothetical protein
MNALLVLALLVADPAKAAAPSTQASARQPAPAARTASPPAPTGQALPGKPVSMQGRDAVDASVPDKYRAEVASAQVQGALLQQEDFAVWVASNALVHSKLQPKGSVTGWLALPQDAQARTWKVSFTETQAQRQLIYADVHVDLTAPPPKVNFVPHAQGRGLSPDERALVKARDSVAQNTQWLRCSDEYNYAASLREGKKGRETVIRALPARHDGKLYLLGGFHEFITPIEGGKSRHFQQTNTCLELPLPKNGVGFMVSHVRSKSPTLFHVFASLSYGRPVYVKTDNRTWMVQDGRVTVVDKKSVKSIKTQEPGAK